MMPGLWLLIFFTSLCFFVVYMLVSSSSFWLMKSLSSEEVELLNKSYFM